MANDFSSDSNILALYNFESGALTTDSKGSNTLTDVNTVAEDAVNYKQGSCSADFELSNSELFYIADSSLPSDWPFKNGTSNNIGSFTCWFKVESFPGSTNYGTIIGKFGNSANCFRIATYGTASIRLSNGYNNGLSADTYDIYTSGATGRWYWIGVSIDATNGRWYYLLWDDTAGAWVAGGWWKPTNTMNIEDAKFTIGANMNAATTYTSYFDGLIDEVTVWKAFLSQADMAAIKAGTYSGTGAHLTMTGARNWYVDPSLWNDATKAFNSGESWTYANWGLLTIDDAPAPGDTVLVKKSAKTSVGTATWDNGGSTITLDTADVTKMIDDGEAAWTPSANVACTTNTTYISENTKSSQITVQTAFTTGMAAYKAFTAANFSAYDRISFFILPTTDIAAGKLRIDLCSDSAGATPVNSFTINKKLNSLSAYFFTLPADAGGSLGSSIQSVALYVVSDLSTTGNVIVYIDDLFACTSSLHLSGAIGLDDGCWFPIRSINGTTIRTGAVQGNAHTYFKHHGTGNNATTYFLEAYPIVQTSGPFGHYNGTSGTAASRIEIKGGINPTDDSQDGYTNLIGQPMGSTDVMEFTGTAYLNISRFVIMRCWDYGFVVYNGTTYNLKFTDISPVACNGVLSQYSTSHYSFIECAGDWYITNPQGKFISTYDTTSALSSVFGDANFTIKGEPKTDTPAAWIRYSHGIRLTGKITIDCPDAATPYYAMKLTDCTECYFREVEIKGGLTLGVSAYRTQGIRIDKLTTSGLTTTLNAESAGPNEIGNLVLSSGSFAATFNEAGYNDLNSPSAWIIERYNADDRWRIDKLDGTISDHITGGQLAAWAYGGSGLSMLVNPNSTAYPLTYSFKMPVADAQAYKLHMQVKKTSSGADCTLKCSIQGAGITPVDAESVSLTDSWAEYASTTFTPDYNGYITVYLSALDGSTTGDIGIDDIHLAEV